MGAAVPPYPPAVNPEVKALDLGDCPITTLALVEHVGQAFQPAIMALMPHLGLAGWKACPTCSSRK
jgi:hypothetical protein